ncbi:MAG: methyltransferase domain-containing protein [Hymenobacteraceae bacterium]|nr:methyltransferase domain-containing protein [Hymenobacteraceae bacterium]MDX5394776.1 methyltransferase domain-containing protein [Hymenobacteraceae bacterium]MDX5510807.1 methyltransferase domain-containing protein [Hymenobacteraceae bacterium]
MTPDQLKIKSVFPRSAQYDLNWVRLHSMGENVLFNLESLTETIPLKKGMRVLDLGCGKAISSVFLAKEFEVQVWAIDEAISATDNYKRICEAGCEHLVTPLQLDARALPFAEGFFDAVIVVDPYTYFGTDEKYLPYICRFLKPGGYIGIVDVCFTHEIETLQQVPAFLRPDYQDYWYFIHSVEWWKKLWEKTGLVHITCSGTLPNADLIRQQYIQDFKGAEDKDPFAKALKQDQEKFISFFRLVGRRTGKDAFLQSFKEEEKNTV